MEINPCLNCISSCCKLEVDITKEEYETLVSLGHSKALLKRSETFIKENPLYKNKESFLDNMYGEDYATIKKEQDGFCSLLDKDTRLCSCYSDRPKVCRDFSNSSETCKKIKKCLNTQ